MAIKNKAHVNLTNVQNIDQTNADNLTSGTVAVARLPLATSSTTGIVQPDNSTITISSGIISTATPAPVSITANTGTTNINWASGGYFIISLEASTTITFSNPIPGGGIVIEINNTGSFTVTFPTAYWVSGVQPTQTANKRDIWTILYNGATYNGSVLQNLSST